MLLAASVTACGDAPIAPEPTAVTGAGDGVIEDRTTGDVERISVAADIDVVIRTGQSPSVMLEGQANVLPTVHTETRDGQLIVNVPSPGFVSTHRVVLTVVVPAVAAVTLSGDARGTVELSTPVLRIDLSGRAALGGTGHVDALTLVASSDARLDFSAVTTTTAVVTMSGGAAATVDVSGSLSGEASGGATLTVVHPPAILNVATTSGASVQGASPSPQ